MTLNDVIINYHLDHSEVAQTARLRDPADLSAAIRQAALSRLPNRKQRPNQHHIPARALHEAETDFQLASSSRQAD
jgi:hypothetical protein